MRSTRPAKLAVILIGGSVLAVTTLHLVTPLELIVLHHVYQRLYYIPIIAAASLFGLRGGLAASAFVTVAFCPHIIMHWQSVQSDYALTLYEELVLFNVIGAVTGAFSDRTKRARERAERGAAELQKAYAELRETFEQLLRADRLSSLGELSAAVVHEVRNPLGAIRGAVEIMEDALPADSPRREFADIAKREVDRLDRLIREFLQFARPPRPSTAPADLNEILRSVVNLVGQRAAKQGVLVELDPAGDLPLVVVDGEQIKQVLLNLAINAVQAMPEGGRLALRTGRSEAGAHVEVEDEGGGVDPAVASRVFDPFFTTKEKGIGLGLSVAYKIAAQHGGTLSARDGARGAVFRLTLPLPTPDDAGG